MQTAAVTDDARQRKAELRRTLQETRRSRPAADRAAAGVAIAAIGIATWSTAASVAAYLSVGDEPPTQGMIDALASHGVRVLLPVIDGEQLDWAAYAGPQDLADGPLGITEPTGERLGTSALVAVAAIVVPALAADRRGNRLGRGRGYYDRALATVTAPIIATVYDNELIADVPVEPHDRRVDAILTPSALEPLSSIG